MNTGIYGGYQIATCNGRGGKAGIGHNRTTTIQVREPLQPGSFLLRAQFRYEVASSSARSAAIMKAHRWVEQHLLPSPEEHPSGLRGEHHVVLDAIHDECLHGR